MRPLVDRPRLTSFLKELGRRVRVPTRLYLVGGCSALVEGWRSSTADVDFVAEPETRELLESLPALKNRLDISVEMASPAHFVPEVAGWRERSQWIEQHGKLQVYHYDFVSQLLAKVERGHRQDLLDAAELLRSLDPEAVWQAYEHMEDELFRYPAIDPASFRVKVRTFLDAHAGGGGVKQLTPDDYGDLPGAELVQAGLADLREERVTREALLVALGAPRLLALGIPVPSPLPDGPEHALWRMLGQEGADVHSAFNALRRRLVSFQRALEHRVRRWHDASSAPNPAT